MPYEGFAGKEVDEKVGGKVVENVGEKVVDKVGEEVSEKPDEGSGGEVGERVGSAPPPVVAELHEDRRRCRVVLHIQSCGTLPVR